MKLTDEELLELRTASDDGWDRYREVADRLVAALPDPPRVDVEEAATERWAYRDGADAVYRHLRYLLQKIAPSIKPAQTSAGVVEQLDNAIASVAGRPGDPYPHWYEWTDKLQPCFIHYVRYASPTESTGYHTDGKVFFGFIHSPEPLGSLYWHRCPPPAWAKQDEPPAAEQPAKPRPVIAALRAVAKRRDMAEQPAKVDPTYLQRHLRDLAAFMEGRGKEHGPALLREAATELGILADSIRAAEQPAKAETADLAAAQEVICKLRLENEEAENEREKAEAQLARLARLADPALPKKIAAARERLDALLTFPNCPSLDEFRDLLDALPKGGVL